MGNCLVTKLKEVVNNDNLIPIGSFAINAEASSAFVQNFSFSVANTKIYIIGDGFVSNTEAGLSEQKKEFVCELANVTYDLYFSSGNYKIVVCNKYYLSLLGTQQKINTEDMKYSSQLTYISADGNLQGDINNLTNLTALGNLYASSNSGLYGNLSILANLLYLNVIAVQDSMITGTVEEFVSIRAINSASGEATFVIVNTPITFGGENREIRCVKWESATKIACGNQVNISDSSTVYCKGYTQVEAEAAFPGKTIIRVDA